MKEDFLRKREYSLRDLWDLSRVPLPSKYAFYT